MLTRHNSGSVLGYGRVVVGETAALDENRNLCVGKARVQSAIKSSGKDHDRRSLEGLIPRRAHHVNPAPHRDPAFSKAARITGC